jgi:hypothetical protein
MSAAGMGAIGDIRCRCGIPPVLPWRAGLQPVIVSGAERGRRSTFRRRLLRVVLVTVAFGVVFALGVALGQATKSSPASGPAVTRIRTVLPLPATRTTVTVTTTVTGGP